jgi:hypothetical protein
MKTTYEGPTVVTRGEFVTTTLGQKPLVIFEDTSVHRKPGGSSLSFGL